MSRMGSGIDLTQGWRGPITQLNQYEDQQQGQIAQAHELQMRLGAAQALRNTSGQNPQPEGQANQLQQAYAQGQQRRQGRSMTSENQTGMGQSPLTKAVTTAKQLEASTLDQGDLTDDQKDMLTKLQNDPSVSHQDFQNALSSLRNQQRAKKPTGTEPPLPQGGTLSIKGGGDDMNVSVPADENQPDIAAAHNAWQNSPKQMQARQSQQRFAATQQRQQQTAETKANKESGDEDVARQQNDEAVQGLLKMKTVPSAILNGDYPTGMDSDDDKKKALGLAKQYKKSFDFLQKRQAEKTGSVGGSDKQPAADQQSQGWQHPATGQQYQEGMVLHSPSTGKAYKIVNGQPQEITNGG